MGLPSLHFEMHFQPNHYILYQDPNKQWGKCCFDTPGLENAVRIQYNTERYKKYIILDIDNNNIFEYREAGLPEPNFILMNKDKVGAHLFYVLDRTVSHKYYKYLWKQIQKGFSILAGADLKNVGHIGKNFNNLKAFKYLEIETAAYNILDLFNYLPQDKIEDFVAEKKILNKPKQQQLFSTSTRNVDVFNLLRFEGYKLIKATSNKYDFEYLIRTKANEFNEQLIVPLCKRELKEITNSIINYCYINEKKIKNKKIKGVLNLQSTDKNLKEKQKIGAEYTNNLLSLQRVEKNTLPIWFYMEKAVGKINFCLHQ